MKFDVVKENLERKGYSVSVFASKEEATAYLNQVIDGTSVGIGGTMTVEEMGLYEPLSFHNEMFWHWRLPEGMTSAEMHTAIRGAEVYISSVNGIAETGEIVNIDGASNRVSNILHGHKKVYLIVGENKVEPTLERAIWRARNIASPKNAQRLEKKTPCAVRGDRCYDCTSPERICRSLVTMMTKPSACEYEVVLIGESLGY